MLHVVIGDVGEYLSHIAKKIDPEAKLCSTPDVEKGVVYTSLSDLITFENLFSILRKADVISYFPPDNWSDGKTRFDAYSHAWVIEHYLHIVKNYYNTKVNNLPTAPSFDGIDWNQPPPRRETQSNQIWVAGCSTTLGVGVGENERYADIVSTHLNLPYTMLAQDGSSNVWSANQIIQSDICSGDTVIWGITTYQRYPWILSKKLFHVTTHSFINYPTELNNVLTLDSVDCETRLYEDIVACNQVINFCKKLDVRLILVGIHANIELTTYLSKFENFVMEYENVDFFEIKRGFLDLGTDNFHPGPKTHKMYAEQIIEYIGKTNA